MTIDSQISGLYRMSVSERVDALVASGALSSEDAHRLKSGRPLLPPERADKLIENVIGSYGLPFAVAPNFLIDGRDFLAPIVVEEPSIVAGLSSAARLIRNSGGFTTSAAESLLAGQVQVVDLQSVESALAVLKEQSKALIAAANELQPRLVARGGGCRDIEFHTFELPDGRPTIVIHFLIDTCDAMGANLTNTVCEHLAPTIESLTGGRVLLRILSNLADRSLVTATAKISLAGLGSAGFEARDVRDGIVTATELANLSPHRAATHNKGIMNGVDAVALATGNDWRAVEASAHAFAVRDGAYRSLSRWSVADDGDLLGELTLPLKVGTVGGSLSANPGARTGLSLSGASSAAELASLMAAVGLAQNFAALRALVTHGIQRGHMRLHARSVAASADVAPEHFDRVVSSMIESGEVKTWNAQALDRALTTSAPTDEDFSGASSGSAAGKVILLGEHAAVYGRHVVALPLPGAVVARVLETGNGVRLVVSEPGAERQHVIRQGAGGIDGLVNLLLDRLDVPAGGLRLRVESSIPSAMGLGSSAAFAVAIIRALDQQFGLALTDRQVNALAFDCEKLAHGQPSGIDNTLATYGEPVLYCRDAEPPVTAIELPGTVPLLIASSGVRGSTRDQVAGVRARYDRSPERYAAIFDEIDTISRAGADALRDRDYATLGALMNLCHGLLNAIEVSVPVLESMVRTARQHGATGAKMTGSGGGGSVVALCPGCEDAVSDALAADGYTVFRLDTAAP